MTYLIILGLAALNIALALSGTDTNLNLLTAGAGGFQLAVALCIWLKERQGKL